MPPTAIFSCKKLFVTLSHRLCGNISGINGLSAGKKKSGIPLQIFAKSVEFKREEGKLHFLIELWERKKKASAESKWSRHWFKPFSLLL